MMSTSRFFSQTRIFQRVRPILLLRGGVGLLFPFRLHAGLLCSIGNRAQLFPRFLTFFFPPGMSPSLLGRRAFSLKQESGSLPLV